MIRKILGIAAIAFGALFLYVLFFGETNSLFLTAFWGVVLVMDGIFLLKNPKKNKDNTSADTISTDTVVAPRHTDNVPAPSQRLEKTEPIQKSEKSSKERRDDYISKRKAEFSETVSNIPRVSVTSSSTKVNRAKEINMPEIKISNITRSTVIDKLFPLVVVDVETTGIKVGGNDIIEVSAIKYDVGFTPVSCFTTLCKPRKPIPADATAINNITDDMVADYPTFHYIAQPFSEYISGCNVVGHNLRFDLRFLFVSGVTLPEKARYFDTLDLAKKVLTKYGSRKYNHRTGQYDDVEDFDVYDYKLETLCDYYRIYRDDAHRSLSDCYATALVFEHLIDDKTA